MSAVLAVWFVGAVVAPGREVPVYREYTKPILFYDDQGKLMVFDAAAPDQAALQSMRDTQAQEAMMGKETILDMAFGTGGSVFGRPQPITGKMSPTASGGDDSRRRKKESDPSWLAKSLSLPGLGQTPNNAAASVISAGAKESSWGWLAGEVAEQSAGETVQPKDKNPESEPGSARRSTMSIQDPETASLLPGAMHDYRSASPVAEMSQTRKAIAEFSVGSRPDYASLPATFASAASFAAPAGLEPPPSTRASWGAASNRISAPAWGGLENPSKERSALPGASSAGTRSWQGGWNAQPFGGSVLSRIESLPDQVPLAEDPVTTYLKSRPRTSSGGYKPAWF